MPTIEHDGPAIHYETYGDDEAPPIVLLHDLASDLRAWLPAARYLADGYRVVLADLRGHGQSAWDVDSAGEVEPYLDDVDRLLAELEVEVCALGGLGFGALVATHYALSRPDRVAALVLGGALARALPQTPNAAAAHDTLHRLGPAMVGLRQRREVDDEYLAGAMQARYQAARADGVAGAIDAMTVAALQLDAFAGLAMPVMVATGEEGPGADAGDSIAAALPRVWRVRVRGAGDEVATVRAQAFAGQVGRFFAAVESGQPATNAVAV